MVAEAAAPMVAVMFAVISTAAVGAVTPAPVGSVMVLVIAAAVAEAVTVVVYVIVAR